MKRFIIFGLTLATIVSIQAAEQESIPLKRLQEDVVGMQVNGKGMLNSKTLGITLPKGVRKNNTRSSETPKGYALYEDFSGWDGTTKGWLPEGWTLDHKGKCSTNYTWMSYAPGAYDISPVAGPYCLTVNYSDKQQDEWLITPIFTPEEDMQLTYHMLLEPVWFYDISNLDWLTQEYIGDKVTAYTLQILIKEENGDWHLLRDYAEEYKDWSGKEMAAISNSKALTKQTLGLEEYVGKKVQLAFRYYGKDGNSMVLDAIGVGYPTLDDVWYMEPANALYWGFSRDSSLSSMPADIALYPAGAPITWSNMSTEDATYSWDYESQNMEGFAATSEDSYELSLQYAPTRPERTPVIYHSPTLNAEANHRVDASYSSPASRFQAGGEPSYTNDEGRQDFTLFQFPMGVNGIYFTGVMDDSQGALSVPVFGYNQFSDVYWLNYSLNGEQALEGNYSHLIGIGNIFFPSSDAPLVVNGMSVYGWGLIGQDAELTATVYAFDSDMHTDPETYTVVGRAKISGKEIQYLDDMGMKDYMYMPFRFEEPVVVQASEEHPAFLFMLEGFRSDKVEYFAPLQTKLPIENAFPSGYILNEINLAGHVDIGSYRSLKSMRYVEDGEYKDVAGSFAIGIDGEYPWLTSKEKAIEFGTEEKVSVALNSYYDASRLRVETPEGIKATISGRYDECVLTVERLRDAESGDIKISGPGVELSIAVSAEAAVSGIDSDMESESVYDLSGRKVASGEGKGVHIVNRRKKINSPRH